MERDPGGKELRGLSSKLEWVSVVRFRGMCPSPFCIGAAMIISNPKSLLHDLSHVLLLDGAPVLSGEPYRVAAFEDSVEDTAPWVVAVGYAAVNPVATEVRRDDHGLACLVAPVDNRVDMLHHVARGALRTQVLDEQEVVPENPVEVPLAVLEG